MPKSKLQKEFQADEDGTVVVPKEIVPPQEVSVTAISKSVKREMSEKQKDNMLRMIQMNKERWTKLREEKAKAQAEETNKRKEEEQKLVEAGTHMRVKISEKKQYKPREKKEPELTPHELPKKPLPLRRQNRRYETKDDSESDDESATETDTDLESDVEVKPRKVRKEIKKNLKVLEKVDRALEQTPSNPYLSMLSSRWR
jgi:hypothetical protein